jgi:hypothetical protein
MTQEKLRRVVTAAVVAGTTLFVILLSVLVYQWITIGVYNDRIDKIEQENQRLEENNAQDQEDLDYYLTDMGKFWLAMQKDFVIKGND